MTLKRRASTPRRALGDVWTTPAAACNRARGVRTFAAVTRRTTEILVADAQRASVWARATAAARARLRPIAGGAADDGAGPPHRTSVVLVVDDHADTREMYAQFLLTMGLVTIEATTCAEALARVATVAVDVLVLDRSLPDGDGGDIVRALKADPQTRAVPIVVLSGRSPDDVTGADAYLVKPVIPDILYEEIKRLLAARRPASS